MNPNDSLKNKNCADEVAILYRNSYGGHVVNFLASTVLAFSFDGMEQTKLIWWATFTALITYRLADSCYWTFVLDSHVDTHNAHRIKNKFLVLVVSTASLWALYPLLMFDSFSTLEFTCAAVVFAAMAGGSVSILSPHKLGAMLYSGLLLIPFSLISLMSDDNLLQLLGGLGIAYAVVILVTAAKSSDFTSEAIALKNENAMLLEQMDQEKEAVKETNEQLKNTLTRLSESKSNLELQVRERTRQIVKLNNRDSLTGLLNRKALLDSIEENIQDSIKKSSSFALFFVDLNGFKKINDSLGHEVGDQALMRVADSLLDLDPGCDVGRWGGDEFVIVRSSMESSTGNEINEEARELASKLSEGLSAVKIPGQSFSKLGASVGISYFPKDGISAAELIRKADVAMFEHKHSEASEPVEFKPEFLARIEEIEKLRDGLASAISNQQLSLMFQPIVNTGTKKITRYEALLRWQFEGAFIPPPKFIGIAEQSGLIVEIGEWVLMQACCAAKRWQAHCESGVSVNVSTLQLSHEDFVPSVKRALDESQLPPAKLNLEITESLLCEDMAKAKTVLDDVKALGVTIAIDDFGTGYSSLAQIQQLPINCIKVDRHFVANMHTNGTVILRATTMMAKEMSLNIVAEGIETAEQLNALHAIGIETFQGYYFAKPLPEMEIEHYACQELTGIMKKAS